MSDKATILVADDEESFRVTLADNLRFEGYEVLTASDGQEAVDQVLEHKPDLLLLDVMMPRLSGFDVCRELQKQRAMVPTIILSARDQELDIVLGLELGADDYLTKPFGLRELLARIKAVLRRRQAIVADSASQGQVRIGEAAVDLVGYELHRQGEAVPLTPREFSVLHLLYERRGEVVSRDTLLNEVWGYDRFPTTRTVDNHMVRLRKAIEPDPSEPTLLLSVRGVGYKLVVP